MRIKISNSPKHVRRRVLVLFWGTVLIAETVWIAPMLWDAMVARFG